MSRNFSPAWYEEEAPMGTFRSIFKWGGISEFKHPNQRLFDLMKKVLNLDDAHFVTPQEMGLEMVEEQVPLQLRAEQVRELTSFVGDENVKKDTYSRVSAAYGKGLIDILRLRKKVIEHIPDVVLHPRTQDDVEKIITYCHQERIPVYVFGGGSSVTRGLEAVRGGVTLDLSVHLNKVVSFNEINQTITVQAGMMGPQLEEILNNAPKTLGAQRRYTCGHFPQSFEYSSVGGWVVTKGAGQNSTYYGKIEDIVAAQEYVTPVGFLCTQDYPRAAIGPDLNQIMLGSEGSFGVLVNVKLKIFRYTPENRKYFSYMFKTWDDGLIAAREIMQSEIGRPSVFRLSDAEETDVALKLYGVEGSLGEVFLNRLGYQPMRRCLLIGSVDGELGYTINLNRKIEQVASRFHAFNLTPFKVTEQWEKDRFRDPYLREDLMDYGILMDTLECAVTWKNMEKVHAAVRTVVKNHPHSLCMTHLSHAYPQGANLYFIFTVRYTDIPHYLELQYSILDAIQKSGAAMSHHHGLGKQTAPWLEGQVGSPYVDVLRSLKNHFDPHNIMNPGGTLGLDMTEEQKNKQWGLHTSYE